MWKHIIRIQESVIGTLGQVVAASLHGNWKGLKESSCSFHLLSFIWHITSPRLYNKVLQTWRLKHLGFIFSQFWRPEIWNQSAGRAVLSLKAPGKNLSLLLLASGGCRKTLMFLGWWQARSNPHLTFIRSSSPCLSVSNITSSYKDKRRWDRTHSNPVWLHLNLITSAKTLIPNTVTFGGTRS